MISYDGSGFSGYQRQPNARSVQGEMEQALAKIHKADSWRSTSSGRTDAGVHGILQPVHFDSPLSIPIERWPRALNALLPDDIIVRSCEIVSHDFHARYGAVAKEYLYKLTTGELDVFRRNYVYQLDAELNEDAMQRAANLLLGTHDFSSYSSPKTDVVDKVRTMYAIDVIRDGDEWTLRFVGSGFLYQMVRVLTGTLLEVGRGMREVEDVKMILEAQDRAAAGKTAPGHGLYLSQVFYDEKALTAHLKETRKK
ncbi:tRNA pseudouridine(38-40) synthase TruA [Paenalkalicoccus suaedae]|uniref:tRNA pseudouridine synthase A n=2 Tax=Paenalkalicoccus suaedae TaxID=2592382 RepID=A0A859FK24_9BACI|nr:tRNA pseudouridine(38-40) synthase TruA [Paenalkalicoccus suaedae]